MAKNYIISKITSEIEKVSVAKELAADIRDVDRREILAATEDVYQEILASMQLSDMCYTGRARKDNKLIAVWGIRKIDGRGGRLIWCLGTLKLEKFWLSFADKSKKIVTDWAEKYGVLFNAVGSFNKNSIRWLKWCGADFGKSVSVGKEKFIPFYIKGGGKKCVV